MRRQATVAGLQPLCARAALTALLTSMGVSWAGASAAAATAVLAFAFPDPQQHAPLACQLSYPCATGLNTPGPVWRCGRRRGFRCCQAAKGATWWWHTGGST